MIENSRINGLKKNTLSSGLLQMTTIICGIIIPRIILDTYGSEINGLVNSITQFLSVIAFMEMGVGAVVQSALYKPLVDKDNLKISGIIRSSERFFHTIAYILLIYILVLLVIYPFIIGEQFDRVFSCLLIVAIGIHSFCQYYFGMPERLLLLADQKGYVHYYSQILALITNTVVSVILIKNGMHIQIVKFVTALIFLIRPLYLKIYVRKHYSINRKVEYKDEPIKQKWNGVAQHFAAVVLDQTDVIVLTLFSTLSNVSIYSIYHFVVFSVKNIFISLVGGVQPLMGEYFARNEEEKLFSLFDWTEWIIHSGTTILFVSTGVLIVPFIKVYTRGIYDVNYIVPLFAALITIANAGHCLRLPYNIFILAAGHYKQTQHNYIIAAFINIFVSVLTVKRFGLVGVAIGTVVAMIYQTIWMAYYDNKLITQYSISRFWKQCIVDAIIVFICILITNTFDMKTINYYSWTILAVQKTVICLFVSLIVNMLLYREKVLSLKTIIFAKLFK